MSKKILYSKEEDDFIREHIDDMTYEEIAHILNRTIGGVETRAYKVLGLRKKNNGRFGEYRIKESSPIGTERNFNGYIWVKTSEAPEEQDNNKRFRKEWEPKQRYIYRQKIGEIPPKSIVIFLDRNSENFSTENLYCVSRSIHATMCKNKWYSDNPNLTLCAIKYLELYRLLKGEK